jgi:hypothetical protein
MQITSGSEVSQLAQLDRSSDLKNLQEPKLDKKEDQKENDRVNRDEQVQSLDANKGQHVDIFA